MGQEPAEGLLTVGLMARRSGLTAKALRHYDRVKLLRPTTVDGAIGYRLYRSDQVAEARLVHLLRSLDLPLDQVRTAVTAWKAGDAAVLVAAASAGTVMARAGRGKNQFARPAPFS